MKITYDRRTDIKNFGAIIEVCVSEECSEQWAWLDRRGSANKNTGMQERDIIIDGLTTTCITGISIIRGQAEAIVRNQFSRFARVLPWSNVRTNGRARTSWKISTLPNQYFIQWQWLITWRRDIFRATFPRTRRRVSARRAARVIIIVTTNGHPGQALSTNYRILRAIILLFWGRRKGRKGFYGNR